MNESRGKYVAFLRGINVGGHHKAFGGHDGCGSSRIFFDETELLIETDIPEAYLETFEKA
ncbi:hypothetical protein RQM65_11965 [Pricia sp. S334]|uniref:DUF1697 domain-containing protein n=1 Tax=Pricia mediterranea TaxID=3076079 RepID=A0ABU3L6L0_9FLAO|nr:hypothetical protein [Pricia sp. S334]MDT7829385.1 hypothetical protein [Pricia sp. S334]